MAPRAIVAFAACASARRISTKVNASVHHRPYETHRDRNCFIDRGGEPVDPEGDPPLSHSTTADECMMACDNTPRCVGLTHHNQKKSCFLRSALHIDLCQSNTDYTSYTKAADWIDPVDDDNTCGDLTEQPNLLCARHIEWAFSHGKHQTWANSAYADMQVISGVTPQAAKMEDFQRLSYCVNFRDSLGKVIDRDEPCEMPPCTCSSPPCDACALERGHEDNAEEDNVDPVLPGCPTPPDNGGCADIGKHNRFCPATGGCFATADEHLCPGLCPPPGDAEDPVAPAALNTETWQWQASDQVFGHWGWCLGNKPSPGWNLNAGEKCNHGPAVNIKVLTYNLFWWNLFGIRGGMQQSAGRLIRQNGPFDLMAFQECDDVNRILADTGSGNEYGRFGGIHAVSTAWRETEWELLAQGSEEVAEDHKSQWYGRRGVVWVRVRHSATGAIVFFADHHGPLPVGFPGGGFCGPEATAYNILKVISNNAHKGDAIILTGDFNAPKGSRTHSALSEYLSHQYQGNSFGGVDNFYSNDCAVKVDGQNLGTGGSDHDALSVTFTVQR